MNNDNDNHNNNSDNGNNGSGNDTTTGGNTQYPPTTGGASTTANLQTFTGNLGAAPDAILFSGEQTSPLTLLVIHLSTLRQPHQGLATDNSTPAWMPPMVERISRFRIVVPRRQSVRPRGILQRSRALRGGGGGGAPRGLNQGVRRGG